MMLTKIGTSVYYIIVGFIFLFSACSDSPKIASIPEASGIDYCANSNTLIVANDEGLIYEISTSGAVLAQQKIKKYDFEGVVCEESDLLLVIEDKGVLRLNRTTGQKMLYKLKHSDLFDKKSGVEGIAQNGDTLYLSKQNKKGNESMIAVVKIADDHLKLQETILLDIPDIAGLTYSEEKLYMVSDKKDLLVVYDLRRNTILKKVKLEKFAQEGIAFDNEGFVYIADDDGAVWKYKRKTLGI